MSAVDREEQPKYGFFILNRAGMNDYIQCISQNDDMEISGQYLMYRSGPPPPQTRTGRRGGEEAKGGGEIIGLWAFATDAREPMSAVMIRLHSYVKKGLPYPEEYR